MASAAAKNPGDEQHKGENNVSLFIHTSYGRFYKIDLEQVRDRFKKSFLAYKGSPPECPGRMNNWPLLSPEQFHICPTVVVLDSVVYMIGGLAESPTLPGSSDVFFLDTRYPFRGWRAAAKMLCPHGDYPPAVALCGKIYVFGGFGISAAEVYDPKLKRWDPLPGTGGPRMDMISFHPVLADPLNSRILVHHTSGSIYAYYPDKDDDEKWRCLVPNFGTGWGRASAVVDDVLYFRPDYSDELLAFDLVRCDLLTTIWNSEFDWSLSGLKWDSLIHMGNGKFFMGIYCPMQNGRVLVQLLSFTAEKRSDDGVIVLNAGLCNSLMVDGFGDTGDFFLM